MIIWAALKDPQHQTRPLSGLTAVPVALSVLSSWLIHVNLIIGNILVIPLVGMYGTQKIVAIWPERACLWPGSSYRLSGFIPKNHDRSRGGAVADPLYQRIANDLRGQIETGQLEPGSQLPPEEKLGKLFDASRNTIRDAIKFLINLGLVETRAGQGTFVVDPPDPLVTTLTTKHPGLGGGEGAAYLTEASERNPRSTIPTVELQTALGEIAYRLGVPEGTPVVSRHERRFIRSKRAGQAEGTGAGEVAEPETVEATAVDAGQPMTRRRGETPWSMQTSFYPRRYALKAERLLDNEDIHEGTVKYLKDTLDLEQVGYRDWITVRAPKNDEVGFFGLPPDGRIPVFEIFRTAFDQNGDPMRVTVTIFPVDRQQFIIDVGEVPAPQFKPAKWPQ
jgi:GntR family transcriptional regulator